MIARHFVKNHLKSEHESPDFKWSAFWMVVTIAITEAVAPPFEKHDHLKSNLQKLQILISITKVFL